MKQLINYLNTYGNYDFSEEPFNDIDNLIFSQLVYTDFEGVLDMQSSLFLCDAAIKFYALNDEKDIDKLIGISEKSARLLYECSKTKRFAYVRLSRYINNVNEEIDKQFAAINFELSKESLVVAFRGTDVTVTGVKESAMLSYMFPVPAQIQALYYFQESAMLHKGEIRILGHSKGGNLAVFAGVSCSNSLKKGLLKFMRTMHPDFRNGFLSAMIIFRLRTKSGSLRRRPPLSAECCITTKSPLLLKAQTADSGSIRFPPGKLTAQRSSLPKNMTLCRILSAIISTRSLTISATMIYSCFLTRLNMWRKIWALMIFMI